MTPMACKLPRAAVAAQQALKTRCHDVWHCPEKSRVQVCCLPLLALLKLSDPLLLQKVKGDAAASGLADKLLPADLQQADICRRPM